VAEKSLGTVDTNATEEEKKEGKPLASFEDGNPEGLFFKTVTGHAGGDGGDAVEDDEEGDPDTPRWSVELVEILEEETNEDVVDQSEKHTSSDGVVFDC
jgi:hypothetical protein